MSDVRTLSVDGASVTVISEGRPDAPRVVVIPPLGMPAGSIAPFTGALAQRFRVSVVELPGAGHASEAHAGVSTRSLAGVLERALAAAGAHACHVVGISLGGMIAEWLAIDEPSRVDRLVLVSSAGSGAEILFADPLEKLRLVTRMFRGHSTRAALAEAIASDGVRGDATESERVEAEIDATPRDDRELVWLLAAVAQHDARPLLGRIRARTLVVAGENDDLVPARVQDALAQAIRGAERVTVAGAGHAVMLDQPEAAARAIGAFLGASVRT